MINKIYLNNVLENVTQVTQNWFENKEVSDLKHESRDMKET